ncbi:MAG TPA: VOC family protein [Candidatus Paceibacterota bacterium]|nr:VOC family protein [Candidatus Paceibacterota bacterium]
MLNHITLLVSDVEKSWKFYAEALKPLGYKLLRKHADHAGFFAQDVTGKRDFWIKLGKKPGPLSFTCLAFGATNTKAVDEFYKAALAAGGTDNGAPGLRPEYNTKYYAAYVLDPDGYNIEAVVDSASSEA